VRLTIRPARQSDLDRIAILLAQFTKKLMSPREARNRFRLVANDPEQRLLVASCDRTVVGLLVFRLRHNIESVSHYGEIACIVVDPEWRRIGVGRRLMEEAEKLALKHRCVGLWLVSGFGRERKAHQFYKSRGFVPTGVRFVKPLIQSGGS
jgi:GNAT superfamily N-acetyltransferase